MPRTSTSRPATPRPASDLYRSWEPPSRTLALTWGRATPWQRALVEEGLVPTLRYYAASLCTSATVSATPPASPPGGLLYAALGGLRWGLVEGLPASQVYTPAMLAAAWWHYLDDGERETLAAFAVHGTAPRQATMLG